MADFNKIHKKSNFYPETPHKVLAKHHLLRLNCWHVFFFYFTKIHLKLVPVISLNLANSLKPISANSLNLISVNFLLFKNLAQIYPKSLYKHLKKPCWYFYQMITRYFWIQLWASRCEYSLKRQKDAKELYFLFDNSFLLFS